MTRRRRVLAVLAVLALAGLYVHGTFDRPLSSIGLNFHECARNGLGATFCGQELKEYRARIEQGKREGEEASRRVKRESEEAAQKAREESELETRHRLKAECGEADRSAVEREAACREWERLAIPVAEKDAKEAAERAKREGIR